MTSYIADIKLLLRGSWARLTSAFALFALSAAMDVACMTVLPVFVVLALSSDRAAAIALPWPASALGPVSTEAFSAAVAALFVARAAVMLLVGSRMAALAEAVRQKIVTRLIAQLLASPYEVAVRRPMSEDVTAATTYSSTFSLNVVLPLLRLVLDILTMLTVLVFVATLEPQVVLVAAAVFAVVALAYAFGIRETAGTQSRRLVQLQTELHHAVSQALSSPREVRVYGLQGYFCRRIDGNLAATASAQGWLGAVYWFPRALGELTLIGLAIAYMIVKARAGTEAVAVVSNLSVLAFAGLRLLPSFAQGMTNVGYLQSGRSVARILAAKLEGASPAEPSDATSPPRASRPRFESLELQDVSFRYEGAPAETLAGVSLLIRRGQSVGVVGASGAGKSTLGDVLLGLLVPTQGRVLLNGEQASLVAERWWSLSGFVPQFPYIANDTLLRNVAYGVPDREIDVALVREAVRLAQLEPVVGQLAKGLDTLLGDQGVRLSGGQRQRVAIARALYRQRDFLVLDEATSALDSETEAEVIGSIEALKGSVTTFIIAHRLSTLRNCDFVIELAGGRIAAARSTSAA